MLFRSLRRRGVQLAAGPSLDKVVHLVKDRAAAIPQLADEAMLFYEVDVRVSQEELPQEAMQGLRTLKARLASAPWQRAALGEALKDVAKSSGLKMPQLAMPLRRIVTGRTQTPSIDAVLELLGRETVLQRLSRTLDED